MDKQARLVVHLRRGKSFAVVKIRHSTHFFHFHYFHVASHKVIKRFHRVSHATTVVLIWKMEKFEDVIRRLFQENNRGKISVQLAHAKIEQVVPSLSMRRRGQLLKKCFGGLKRGKPGPSKGNPCRQWTYYGIELKSSNDDGGANGIDGICLPSDWGKGHADTPPLLNGLDNILRNVAVDTPPEVTELRKKVESLEKELATQKKKDAESTMIRRFAGRLPPSMLLKEDLLPSGKHVGAGTYGHCELSKYKEVPVVVKKFKNPDKLSQLRVRDSVIEEAKNILNLQSHRNLPQLVGVCIGQMPYSLVTQYWGDREDESLTIFRVLRSKRLLGTVPWVKVIQEVMDGLAAIHRSGIVHNDIKGNMYYYY